MAIFVMSETNPYIQKRTEIRLTLVLLTTWYTILSYLNKCLPQNGLRMGGGLYAVSWINSVVVARVVKAEYIFKNVLNIFIKGSKDEHTPVAGIQFNS